MSQRKLVVSRRGRSRGVSPLFELKVELRRPTFNSQKKCFKNHIQHVGPINVRGPVILPHVLFECRVKLTARVIRSVFQSLKISNVASEPASSIITYEWFCRFMCSRRYHCCYDGTSTFYNIFRLNAGKKQSPSPEFIIRRDADGSRPRELAEAIVGLTHRLPFPPKFPDNCC